VNRFVLIALALATGATGAACNAKGPPGGFEQTCARACEARDKACEPAECWRGCNLVLDRLAEHEGEHVIACVATAMSGPGGPGAPKACDDRLWARCAARIGAHADGGPPAPPPPRDFEDVDEE
jgi:hypothetical protein